MRTLRFWRWWRWQHCLLWYGSLVLLPRRGKVWGDHSINQGLSPLLRPLQQHGNLILCFTVLVALHHLSNQLRRLLLLLITGVVISSEPQENFDQLHIGFQACNMERC
ncbi:unnamed protein product [Chrysoparadoxa australica]